jgi:hypothetical protein
MIAWLVGENMPGYTPAAFFLHFGEGYENGSAGRDAASEALPVYGHGFREDPVRLAIRGIVGGRSETLFRLCSYDTVSLSARPGDWHQPVPQRARRWGVLGFPFRDWMSISRLLFIKTGDVPA